MRDEKEKRSKQGQQTNKAKQHSTPKAVTFPRKMKGTKKNRHIGFLALVALKLLVSLISRLVACSPSIVADKQTNRHTERLL